MKNEEKNKNRLAKNVTKTNAKKNIRNIKITEEKENKEAEDKKDQLEGKQYNAKKNVSKRISKRRRMRRRSSMTSCPTHRKTKVILVLAVHGVGEVLIAGLRQTVLLVQDVQDAHQLGLHQV